MKQEIIECEGCGIILNDHYSYVKEKGEKKGKWVFVISLFKPSLENPKRCEDCVHFEDRIKDVCNCGNTIVNNVKNYLQNGNICHSCINAINRALKPLKHI